MTFEKKLEKEEEEREPASKPRWQKKTAKGRTVDEPEDMELDVVLSANEYKKLVTLGKQGGQPGLTRLGC